MHREVPPASPSSSPKRLSDPDFIAINRPSRILLLDDDEMLVRFLRRMLQNDGFTVDALHDGSSASQEVVGNYDLLLLDLNLPGTDGLAILDSLRRTDVRLPILILSARVGSEHAVAALEAGADDYLSKPFSYDELRARLRALLRRHGNVVRSSSCADLILDRERMSAIRAGRRVDLTQREYSILEYLMRTPHIPVPRTKLLHEIWGEHCNPSTNVVDVYMKYVRDKVDLPGMAKLIRTVRGTGYVVTDV